MGGPAYSVFIVNFCIEFLAQIARLVMVRKRLKLSIRIYILKVYIPIIVVAIVAAIIPLLVVNLISYGIIQFIAVSIVSVISVAATSFLIGLTESERLFFIDKYKLVAAKIKK